MLALTGQINVGFVKSFLRKIGFVRIYSSEQKKFRKIKASYFLSL